MFGIFGDKEKKRIREKSADCIRFLNDYDVELSLAGKGLLGEAISGDTHTIQILPTFMSCLLGQEWLNAGERIDKKLRIQNVAALVLADIDKWYAAGGYTEAGWHKMRELIVPFLSESLADEFSKTVSASVDQGLGKIN